MSEEKMEHSPLPWKVGSVTKSLVVTDTPCPRMIAGMTADYNRADPMMEADASYIVRACNSYYENKAAIAELVEALEPFAKVADARKRRDIMGGVCFSQKHLIKARAIIAKHKAGE